MFEVTDTGIGIAPDAIPNLFSAFTQADDSMTRRYGGTGLGLAICRRLCEMLGGSISVESSPGKGSSFRCVVPTGPLNDVPMVAGLEALAGRHAVQPSGPATLKGRILVADDSVDNQRLIAFHLKRAGADVDVAVNGREAVRKALESLNDRRGAFDLILMDMQMPELDGYQATAALRARGWDAPIVALTANGAENERERCLASGCDDFESKPVSRDDLLDACKRWLERSVLVPRRAA
jgi:CheY-like chemotaxis protein